MLVRNIYILIGDFRLAGAEVVGVNLANMLSIDGNRVGIICLRDQGQLRTRLYSSVEVICIDRSITFAVTKLRAIFREMSRDDVVISTIRNLNLLSALAVLFLDVRPTLLFREANTYRNLKHAGIRSQFYLFAYQLLVPWGYSKAIRIIANSTDTGLDVIRMLRAGDRRKVKVVGNPVLLELPKILERGERGVRPKLTSNDQINILSVGRLHPQKDYPLALSVFANLKKSFFPNAVYTIVGVGELRGYLEKRAEDLSLSVGKDIIFRGELDDLRTAYSSAEVFLMTSRWEGFGNVLVEALAHGVTPVVAECPGGPRDILQGGVGAFVQSRDPVVISQVLADHIINPTPSSVLRERAKQYSAAVIAREYLR